MTARLHYLDALRSCAMLLGLLVHAGTLAHEPVSSAVNVVSEHFRMATFFVVSGFFAALLAQRRGPIAYVRARVAVLLVPLCTGLVLLNPLTNWLIYLWHAGPVGFGDYLAGARPHPSAGPQVWHLHLWFLVSLSVYVALVPLVAPILRYAGTGRVLARLAGLGLWLVPALAVLVVAHEIGMRGLWRMTLERPLADTPLNWLPRVTATYWVYFVIGMAAATHQALFEAMHRFSLPTFAAGFALYAVLAVLPADASPVGRTMLGLAAEETITIAAVCGLLGLFRRLFSEPRAWVARLSDSVYTIYLLHFLLIYLLALALHPLVPGVLPLYAVVTVLAGVTGYAFHHAVVARWPVMALLFNGRLPARAQADIPARSASGTEP
jgi:glucans biosynthesis protein C